MKPVILAAGTGVVVAGVTAAVLLYGVPALHHEPAAAPPAALTSAPPPPPVVGHHVAPRPVEHHYRERPRERYTSPAAYAPPPPPVCSECGIVESVRQERVAAKPTGGGAILGGIAGAVLGHQLGNGRGRDLATVAGAAGGAFLGNRVEETARGHEVYDVTVRRDNGVVTVLRQATPLTVGQKVQIQGGQAVPE